MVYSIKDLLAMRKDEVKLLWWNNIISFSLMCEYDRIKWEAHTIHFNEDIIEDKKGKTLFDKLSSIRQNITNKFNTSHEEFVRNTEMSFQSIIYNNMDEAVQASIYTGMNNHADECVRTAMEKFN